MDWLYRVLMALFMRRIYNGSLALTGYRLDNNRNARRDSDQHHGDSSSISGLPYPSRSRPLMPATLHQKAP